MKKIIALLLAMMMILCLFAGCAEEPVEEDQDPVEDNTPVEEDPVEEEEQDPVEENTPVEEETEEPINFLWFAAGGTDTHIENPHRDNQCPLPEMLWEAGYRYDRMTGEYEEMLGTNWTVNEDFTVFSMEIKPGIYWHDGSEVTVDDLVWSIQDDIMNPNSTGSNGWNTVVGYDAYKEGTADTLEGMVVEGNKVTITLTQPNVTWGKLRSVYILPAKYFEGVAWADVDTSDYFKNPVGTGAFKIEEVSFPDYVTVVRNEEYHGELAGFKRAKYISYAAGGNDAAVAAMIAGEIDFGTRQMIIDGSVANNICTQNPDVKYIKVNGSSLRVFNWRFATRADGKETPWINDVRVRQAVDLLINQDMLSAMLAETTSPSWTLMAPSHLDYNNDVAQVSYDPERAKELLDEAGWDYENNVIDLAYYYDDETTHNAMLALEQDFASIGVQLNTFLLTGDLSAALYTDMNYDICLSQASYDAVNNSIGIYSQISGDGGYTFVHNFGAAEFVEKYNVLYDEYQATADVARRNEIALELQAMNAEDCIIMPGYVNSSLVAYNTTTLEIPEYLFEAGSLQGDYQWHLWKNLK